MNTRLDNDPAPLDLVRAADPMLDPRVHANAGLDTESALRLLAPKLDLPPAPQRARRRRRMALRVAVVAGVVVAAVFVAVNVASTGNGSDAVSPAQAQMLRHIRDALVWPAHAIYEEDVVTTVTARKGATHNVEYHKWMSTSAPYNNRLIVIVNGKVLWEQTVVNGRVDLYDPTTNTVYLARAAASNQSPDEPQSNSVLAEVQYLLRERNVKVNPNAMLDGARAIELTFDGGRFSYWISPRTYRPLQVEDRWFPGITRYPIVRVLTGPAASPSLWSPRAQHPDATVDHSPADYKAAFRRLIEVRGAQTWT
jgi:outer membrane lipoprotein-sorting protein